MHELARRLQQNQPLSLLTWLAQMKLTGNHPPDFRGWPDLSDALEEDASLYYMLLGLSIAEVTLQRYEQKGIPGHYALASLARLGGKGELCQQARGRCGLLPGQLNWFYYYPALRVFRLGRMEYMPVTLTPGFNIMVFRHRQSGEILAVNGPEARWFSRDGECLLSSDADGQAAFGGGIIRTPGTLLAFPFHPTGVVLPHPVNLDTRLWEAIVRPESGVLEMHIPEGGGLTIEKCQESLQEALQFFATHWPETAVNAICCASWMFWHRYEEMLPDSNIARFCQEVYLFPFRSKGNDGLASVFGHNDGDLTLYPRRTSLQRAMLDTLHDGGKLRTGGMFILPEHLSCFGTQFYRKQTTLARDSYYA